MNKKKLPQSSNVTPIKNENYSINNNGLRGNSMINNNNTSNSSNLKMNLNNLINNSGSGMNNKSIGNNNIEKQFSNETFQGKNLTGNNEQPLQNYKNRFINNNYQK